MEKGQERPHDQQHEGRIHITRKLVATGKVPAQTGPAGSTDSSTQRYEHGSTKNSRKDTSGAQEPADLGAGERTAGGTCANRSHGAGMADRPVRGKRGVLLRDLAVRIVEDIVIDVIRLIEELEGNDVGSLRDRAGNTVGQPKDGRVVVVEKNRSEADGHDHRNNLRELYGASKRDADARPHDQDDEKGVEPWPDHGNDEGISVRKRARLQGVENRTQRPRGILRSRSIHGLTKLRKDGRSPSFGCEQDGVRTAVHSGAHAAREEVVRNLRKGGGRSRDKHHNDDRNSRQEAHEELPRALPGPSRRREHAGSHERTARCHGAAGRHGAPPDPGRSARNAADGTFGRRDVAAALTQAGRRRRAAAHDHRRELRRLVRPQHGNEGDGKELQKQPNAPTERVACLDAARVLHDLRKTQGVTLQRIQHESDDHHEYTAADHHLNRRADDSNESSPTSGSWSAG